VYSEILFMHLDEPGPLGSLDISYFWIDEAHEPDGKEVPEATFDMLTARLRHPIGPHRGFITSNSGGKDWVWNKFFNPANRVTLAEYIGWTVPTSANAKYLPDGYVEELTRTHPQVWVDRFLNASFDSFEGQIFTKFNEDVHVYDPKDVELSPLWDYEAGFDFGVSAPTACVYGSIDRDNRLYVYEEDYQAEADIPDFANRIKKRGYSSVNADPSVVNRGPNKKSPKQLYQDCGVYLSLAPNDTDTFITLFNSMLDEILPDGKPRIMISKKCVHLIDQIKQAAWDPRTIAGSTHDKIKVSENHALDAFKYLLNSVGFKNTLIDPIKPGKAELSGVDWEQQMYMEDTDFDSDNYCHPEIKEVIQNAY
jgi:hypothetical protein